MQTGISLPAGQAGTQRIMQKLHTCHLRVILNGYKK